MEAAEAVCAGDPVDPIEIHANIFGDPGDLKAATSAIELCRDMADSDILHPFLKREIMPGSLKESALEQVVRNSVSTIWHQSCTAKMGRDPMSVVDSHLTVYGIDNFVSRTDQLCRAYQPATQWRLVSSSANAAQRY